MATQRNVKQWDSNRAAEVAAVADFLRKADHPLKPVLEAIRTTILAVDPKISEGIKWNGPSFFFKDYFATTGFRAKGFIHLVFHTGAKIKASATHGLEISDPTGLLEWHAKDRCSAKFSDLKDFAAKKRALQDIV